LLFHRIVVIFQQGRATWGGAPPKKSKKGGPNLRGGGPGMLELQIFFKMKDFFAENFGNFWKKVVLRKISGTFVFEKFSGKILICFSENFFLGGPGMEGGPTFGIHPPTGNRLARPLLSVEIFFSVISKKNTDKYEIL
jgi:hypothetical protein